MRFHHGPYVRGSRIAMQMTSYAGRTATVLRVKTIEEMLSNGEIPRPRDTGSLEAPGEYPVLHPCWLIVQFDGPDPEVEGPIEIDGADCAGLVDGYPITHADCLRPLSVFPPEVIEAMVEISRHDHPQITPQEYDCGCVAIQRITDRDSRTGHEPFEMALAIRCSHFGFDQAAVQGHLGVPIRTFVGHRPTRIRR